MIDDHAHPFSLEFAPLDFSSLSLDVGTDPRAPERRQRQAAGRLFQELLTTTLASLLDVDPDDVQAARDEAAAADWPGYVRKLFDDAQISGMILDDGVTSGADTLVPAYAELLGRHAWRLARVDPIVDELIGAGASASEVVAAVEDFMTAAASHGAVGFKTVLAYRTGLAVDPRADLAAAEASLVRGRRASTAHPLPVRRRAKPLRDLVMCTMLGRAADLNLPVQIHTGFGDSELRLAESDPLLLEELLHSPAGSAATIILIHGSYPWHEKVAYLATVRPNVYAEVSLSTIFAPLGTAERLARVLDLAPRNKVLVGSDGHHVPESHWFACRTLRNGFDDLSRNLSRAGARRTFIESTREALFEGNARAVYRLR
jgi:predicted TIM-barrel fold metal-dependent hydrolase